MRRNKNEKFTHGIARRYMLESTLMYSRQAFRETDPNCLISEAFLLRPLHIWIQLLQEQAVCMLVIPNNICHGPNGKLNEGINVEEYEHEHRKQTWAFAWSGEFCVLCRLYILYWNWDDHFIVLYTNAWTYAATLQLVVVFNFVQRILLLQPRMCQLKQWIALQWFQWGKHARTHHSGIEPKWANEWARERGWVSELNKKIYSNGLVDA